MMGDFGGGFAQGFGQQFQAQQQRGLEAQELKLRQQALKSHTELEKLQGQKILMEIQNDPNAFFEKFMGMLQGQQPGPTGTLPQAPMGGAGQPSQMGGLELGGVTVGPSGPSLSFKRPEEPKLPAGTSAELAGAMREIGADPTRPENFSQANVAMANRLLQERRVQISRETGAATAQVKREQPLGGEASNFINPNSLQAAPPTMSEMQAITGGFVKVTPEQKKELADLGPVSNVVDTLTAYSDRLITARTPVEAAKQFTVLSAGALVKSNALAAAYNDSKEAFTGTISRTLGGERGVLTDRDIKRMAKLLPNFRDTVAIKELKNAFFRNALESAVQQRKNVITGRLDPNQARQENASKIEAMFNRLEQSGVPKGDLVIHSIKPVGP